MQNDLLNKLTPPFFQKNVADFWGRIDDDDDRYKMEESPGATEAEIEAAFNKIDKDKSGSINIQVVVITIIIIGINIIIMFMPRQELKLSNRFLAKTFGLKDVSASIASDQLMLSKMFESNEQAKAWEKLMKETDNGDGNLTYNEFADLVRRGQSQAFRGKIVK